jgi:hypothetical protein
VALGAYPPARRPGAQVNDGFGVVTLTIAPFKLTAEGK